MLEFKLLEERLEKISLGLCVPSHLTFDSKKILFSISVLKFTINVKEYLRQPNGILSKISSLLNNKILKNSSYDQIEGFVRDYDGSEIPIITILESIPSDQHLGLYETILCTKENVLLTENALRDELLKYQEALLGCEIVKPRIKKEKVVPARLDGLMRREYVATPIIDKIIAYRFSNDDQLFTISGNDQDNIKKLFEGFKFGEFQKQKIVIRLGVPLKVFAYLFSRMSKEKIVIAHYQNYFHCSKCLICEDGDMLITNDQISQELHKFNKVFSVKGPQKISERNRRFKMDSDNFVKMLIKRKLKL